MARAKDREQFPEFSRKLLRVYEAYIVLLQTCDIRQNAIDRPDADVAWLNKQQALRLKRLMEQLDDRYGHSTLQDFENLGSFSESDGSLNHLYFSVEDRQVVSVPVKRSILRKGIVPDFESSSPYNGEWFSNPQNVRDLADRLLRGSLGGDYWPLKAQFSSSE